LRLVLGFRRFRGWTFASREGSSPKDSDTVTRSKPHDTKGLQSFGAGQLLVQGLSWHLSYGYGFFGCKVPDFIGLSEAVVIAVAEAVGVEGASCVRAI